MTRAESSAGLPAGPTGGVVPEGSGIGMYWTTRGQCGKSHSLWGKIHLQACSVILTMPLSLILDIWKWKQYHHQWQHILCWFSLKIKWDNVSGNFSKLYCIKCYFQKIREHWLLIFFVFCLMYVCWHFFLSFVLSGIFMACFSYLTFFFSFSVSSP